MIYIQFSENKKFTKKAIPFYEGIELLAEKEKQFTEENQGTVRVAISGASTPFTGVITLGTGIASELITYIEDQLSALYPDSKQELAIFIDELAGAYAEGRESTKNAIKEPRKKERSRNTFSVISLFHKKIVQMVLASVLILIFFAGVFFFLNPFVASISEEPVESSTEQSSESLKDLLDSSDPLEVVKDNPDSQVEIVRILAASERFADLEVFQEEYPTEEGNFYLSFYKKDWNSVISNPASTLSKEQQVMLAHAYIQLGKLKEAEIMNDQLQSDQLNTEISEGYRKRAVSYIREGKIKEAEELQKQLQDQDLSDLIETAKTCQEMIAFYKQEKDVENQEIWLNRLKNLGKDQENND